MLSIVNGRHDVAAQWDMPTWHSTERAGQHPSHASPRRRTPPPPSTTATATALSYRRARSMVSTRRGGAAAAAKEGSTEGAGTKAEGTARRTNAPPSLLTFARQNPELVLGMLALLAYIAYNVHQMATGTGRWKILYEH